MIDNKTSGNIKWLLIIPPILIIIITTIMFSEVIFNPGVKVLSHSGRGSDVSQFVYFRDFGFSNIKSGNLPLWNPYIFCGVPFLGNIQSSLLYPFNLIFLVLTINKAINIIIVIHVILIGLFTYYWLLNRNIHPLSAFMSSVLLMFSSAYFMHIYPCHLSNLCTMAWIPLLFLSIDGYLRSNYLRWYYIGILSVSMQILGGHIQYAYYAFIAAVIYSILYVIYNGNLYKAIKGILIIYLGALLVSAVQIIPFIEAIQDGTRSGAMPYEFAASFSFPIRNLITLIVPGFFGDIININYWGKWNLWEMNIFIGITGFILAIYAVKYGKKPDNKIGLFMLLILLIFAFGKYTPLFNIFIKIIPFYAKFRGNSKFIFFASMFLIYLASMGFDHLLKEKYEAKKIALILIAASLMLCFFGIYGWYSSISSYDSKIWGAIVPKHIIGNNLFAYNSGVFASQKIIIASGITALLSLLFYFRYYTKIAMYVILIIALSEVVINSKKYITTIDINSVRIPQAETFLKENPGDYRVCFSKKNENIDIGMSMQVCDIGGKDADIPRRYAEWIAFTQNEDYNKIDPTKLSMNISSPLLSLVRYKYKIDVNNEECLITEINKNHMPKLKLIDNYIVLKDKASIFKKMASKDYDLYNTVILEEEPDPRPSKPASTGKAKLIQSSSDELIIEADLPSSALLLITDNYNKGWKIESLEKSNQKEYKILPADYILRVIPLEAGYHKLKVEYYPASFIFGKWISIISLFVLVSFPLYKKRCNKFFKQIS